jgi:hypothetical protein
MSIIKVLRRENPFVQIDKSVFEDNTISWKAKGILGYLLTKPNDWKIYVDDIAKHAPTVEKEGKQISKKGSGLSAVYEALKELRAAGYARLTVTREGGVITGKQWEVSEIPVLNGITPYPDNLNMENVDEDNLNEANRAHTNKEDSNKEYSNNDKKVSANADVLPKKSIEPIDEAFTPLETLSKKRKNAPGAQKEKKVEALPPMDFSNFDNPEKAGKIFSRWLEYRKDIKRPYKSDDTILTALKNLFNYSGGLSTIAEQIIEKSIGNGYQGFFKPEIKNNGNSSIPKQDSRFNSAETIASAQRIAESMREYWQ